jgi:hypothetical protein
MAPSSDLSLIDVSVRELQVLPTSRRMSSVSCPDVLVCTFALRPGFDFLLSELLRTSLFFDVACFPAPV